MSALAASRRLLHLRAGLELCLRPRAHTSLSSSWANGMARCRCDPPRRKIVTSRRGALEEGSVARDKAMLSPDEQFSYCENANGTTLEPIGKNMTNEFGQLSLEEESDDVVCEISERVARDVQKAAIELLAGRAFTVSELRKKLRSRKYPVDTVDALIADFKSRGLLNDGSYAESFSRSRWQTSTWGPRRIKQALRQKGVPEAEVDQATRSVFQDGSHAKEATYGISEASMDHLFAQAAKQWQRGQSLTLENRRARIVRWLQYRGFQLGCDQYHCQEAGGSAPCLTLLLC